MTELWGNWGLSSRSVHKDHYSALTRLAVSYHQPFQTQQTSLGFTHPGTLLMMTLAVLHVERVCVCVCICLIDELLVPGHWKLSVCVVCTMILQCCDSCLCYSLLFCTFPSHFIIHVSMKLKLISTSWATCFNTTVYSSVWVTRLHNYLQDVLRLLESHYLNIYSACKTFTLSTNHCFIVLQLYSRLIKILNTKSNRNKFTTWHTTPQK